MTCIRCEVTRARLLARSMRLVGKSNSEIVIYLVSKFNAAYFLDGERVMRHNFPTNFEILGKQL